ncbi:uncharacterized protein [Pocillopora verrucosa]|uniref:uncharacterized protein isoform X3 n=1 Tax=Pocillopora verrucosa TaxID=203993 RepID=UPI00333E9669
MQQQGLSGRCDRTLFPVDLKNFIEQHESVSSGGNQSKACGRNMSNMAVSRVQHSHGLACRIQKMRPSYPGEGWPK